MLTPVEILNKVSMKNNIAEALQQRRGNESYNNVPLSPLKVLASSHDHESNKKIQNKDSIQHLGAGGYMNRRSRFDSGVNVEPHQE